MSSEYWESHALLDDDAESRFTERLEALTAYREIRSRKQEGAMQPGDRARLRAALAVLERTGGVPAQWVDTR